MNPEDFFNQISKTSYTKAELIIKVGLIKLIADNQFFGGGLDLTPEQARYFSEVEEFFKKHISEYNYNQFISELNQFTANYQPLIIYTAIELDNTNLVEIGKWLKNRTGELAIFEHMIDPKLIGGIAVVKNGIFKDYSLYGKIEDLKPQIITDFKNSLIK